MAVPINNEDEFQAEKAELIAQKEAANKRAEEAQAKIAELKLETQFESAYRESGGRADSEAYELLSASLARECRLRTASQYF